MNKRSLLSSVYILTAIVIIINIAFFVRDSFFGSLKVLPKGDFLFSAMSPTGEYTVSMYSINSNIKSAARGELVTVDSNGQINRKNIYWNVGKEGAMVTWITSTIVSIDDVLIDVTSGNVFDSTKAE